MAKDRKDLIKYPNIYTTLHSNYLSECPQPIGYIAILVLPLKHQASWNRAVSVHDVMTYNMHVRHSKLSGWGKCCRFCLRETLVILVELAIMMQACREGIVIQPDCTICPRASYS